MMFSRILAVLIVIGATLWIGSGVFGRTEEPTEAAPAEQAAEQPRFRVSVIPARLESHARAIIVSGRTEADNRASAVARTAGSIVELKVRRGDRVEEGDVIATLSDEARLAQVEQARALVEQRRTDLNAQMQLIKRGVSARNTKNELEANLAAAEAALAQAETEQQRGQIVAPIGGVVSDVPVTAGQSMQVGTTVAEIVALDPMLAMIEVAERQLGGIKIGDQASVRLVTGETAEGEVRFISPTASEQTRTYRVDIQLDNDNGRIPDGITAEVQLKLAPVDAVQVPRSALTFSAEGKLSVRTVAADGVVASVPVSIVEDSRDTVWLAGIPDGSRIIIQGQDFVKEGQVVEAVEAPPAPAQISRS